ncbi:MAG: hypothetical protein NTZ97_02875 [Candidatus Moranbacteria bacterium]|nr:hypothetical protein [Candidatus Moranbacteria bacterium]
MPVECPKLLNEKKEDKLLPVGDYMKCPFHGGIAEQTTAILCNYGGTAKEIKWTVT